MSILTYTSNERPVEIQMDLPTCCGQKPEVITWKRKMLVAVHCRNVNCPNHQDGVLCGDAEKEIRDKWERFRSKEAS